MKGILLVSTVIKANESYQSPKSAAFNFDDMAQQAQAYLDKIRQQAQEILNEAQREGKSIRQNAEKEGRQEGQRAIEQMTEQQVARQMETVLPALRQAVKDLEQARHGWLTHWEQRAVHVAAAMAARVVRRELKQAPEISLALVREALELSAGTPQVQIRLHPADHQTLGRQVELLVQEFGRNSQVSVVGDPQITAGGCRLDMRHGVIDQQIEAQLARIEEELNH